MMRTAQHWLRILEACGVAPATAARWADVFADEVKDGTFSKGDSDLADFLPNILHESMMLERMEESLNYTPEALLATFNTTRSVRITSEQAQRFGRIAGRQAADQRAIASTVYGGEWGREKLGNVLPGDGWTYRGRSPIQITGRANYERVGDLMRQNLVGIPDLLAQPRFALEACIAWWEDRIPDSLLGETTAVRKRVNGGTLGLAEVQALTIKAKAALEANHA